MAKERLWALGNREPSDFVRALEMARRRAEGHREASAEAWQDHAALLQLLPETVGRLLVLEDERESFLERLTVSAPPTGDTTGDLSAMCQDALGGSLAAIAQDALRKGWGPEDIYRAMVAYGNYMLAFTRNSMGMGHMMAGLNLEEKAAAVAEAQAKGYGALPPYGTKTRSRQTTSNEM
ncbi:hypothetical protein [Pelagibacterium lacus]|uniref:Uncharacterized protein n=1 Tax=Pelagibacterium lacus TaxID=2282655 RepID=A0A369W8R2_9HYPH|nr:hypothetical protein [Pelagibacterium lacus]RDE08451.1 hypothetical protein DVH29_11310 [Pelagibacterium lacus]